MKRALYALVFVPHVAAAQVPVYPSNSTPSAPTTLDPGSTGSQAPAPPPPPATAAPAQPNVVVVRPDGTVSSGQQEAAPTNFYMEGAGGDVPDQEPAEIHAGPTPELHVVRSGDTLWDICWYYFNDPWQWPKVWSFNPQITNPHWIYPGDLVRLLPRGMFAQQGAGGDGGTGAQGNGGDDGTGTAMHPADNLPPPQQKLQVGLKQTAFVEKSDLDRSITIDGSVDEKTLLGPGDSVYLSYPAGKPPQVGQRYSIYRPDNEVKGVGSYVRLLGTVEVVSVKQDKRARGVIVDSNQEIERGAKVGPLVKSFKTVPPVPPSVDAQGSIVAMLKSEQLIGQGEVVFVNLGQSSGVKVGNRLFVVRRGDAYPGKAESTVGQDDRRFPARALGEVVIVEVGEKISVALVTLSVQEMGLGDLVIMQKAD